MSESREALQAQLVNPGAYRTHFIRRESYRPIRRALREFIGQERSDPEIPAHWTFYAMEGWIIGDACTEAVEGRRPGGLQYGPSFTSATIYLTAGGGLAAVVEEKWDWEISSHGDYSVFQWTTTLDTPSQLREWLSRSCASEEGVAGKAWEKACQTYPRLARGDP